MGSKRPPDDRGLASEEVSRFVDNLNYVYENVPLDVFGGTEAERLALIHWAAHPIRKTDPAYQGDG